MSEPKVRNSITERVTFTGHVAAHHPNETETGHWPQQKQSRPPTGPSEEQQQHGIDDQT